MGLGNTTTSASALSPTVNASAALDPAPYTAPLSTDPSSDPFLAPQMSTYTKSATNWQADTASLLCSDSHISASQCAQLQTPTTASAFNAGANSFVYGADSQHPYGTGLLPAA